MSACRVRRLERLGLADILFVVTNATRVALDDPAAMRPLLELPFAVLPLFLVPLSIASHVLLFVRRAGARSASRMCCVAPGGNWPARWRSTGRPVAARHVAPPWLRP